MINDCGQQKAVGQIAILKQLSCYFNESRVALSQFDQLLHVGPAMRFSTFGCSSAHNNTLQVLQWTIGPRTS